VTAKAPPPAFPNMTVVGGGAPKIAPGAHICDGVLIDTHAPVTIGEWSFTGHRVMILTGSHDMFRFGADRLGVSKPRPVTIGRGVWLCSGCLICPGVTVGDHAVVGPGAVVMRNVAPYTLVAGNPARFVRRLRSKDHGTHT
jgi:maltose O-acetyltransferase